MFPFSSGFEYSIAIPKPASPNANGVLAYFEKYFQRVSATVEHSSPLGLVITLDRESFYDTPRSLRGLRRVEIEVRPHPIGLGVFIEVHYRTIQAVYGITMGALGIALMPVGGILAHSLVGVSLAFVPGALAQKGVRDHFDSLCRDIEASYFSQSALRQDVNSERTT